MRRWLPRACCIPALLLLAAPLAPAQNEFAPEQPQRKTEAGPRRKQPGWRRRPEKQDARAQLQYADALRAAGRTRQAAKQYDALVHAWPTAPEAAVAQRAYADLLLARGKQQAAFDEFQYLIDNYPGRFPFEEVLGEQFRIANHMSVVRHGGFLFFRGARDPARALPLYETILKNAPQWARAPEAQFQIGRIQEDVGEYELATAAYELLLLRYPRSALAAEASFGCANCRYQLAKAGPRDEEAGRRAFAALSVFLRDYPADARCAEAETSRTELKERLAAMSFERAAYYDEIAKRPEAARIAYADFIARFPTSTLRERAEQRLRALAATTAEKNHEQ
jgi:outer membrane protein assembly factor BamD (BamD/ComL family)